MSSNANHNQSALPASSTPLEWQHCPLWYSPGRARGSGPPDPAPCIFIRNIPRRSAAVSNKQRNPDSLVRLPANRCGQYPGRRRWSCWFCVADHVYLVAGLVCAAFLPDAAGRTEPIFLDGTRRGDRVISGWGLPAAPDVAGVAGIVRSTPEPHQIDHEAVANSSRAAMASGELCHHAHLRRSWRRHRPSRHPRDKCGRAST